MIYCNSCGAYCPWWRQLLRVLWRCRCGVGLYRPGVLARSIMVINPRGYPMRTDIPDFGRDA